MKDTPTILAIDDSPESLALLVRILTPEGYRVLPADSGELALKALDTAFVAAEQPDLILLDIRMEGMDGFEVCRRLKEREETRRIPVILFSAYADVNDWVHGLRLGASDYITKPFRAEELLSRVKTHLALRLATVSLEELRREIGERDRAEETLKAAARYTRTLIETSLDPLITINPEGMITDVNKATEKVTGVGGDELIGSDFADYFTEPEAAREGYLKAFTRGQVIDYPLAIRHLDGSITDVLYNASVYRNDSGRVLGVFAAARDITEHKRAEEALHEALRQNRNLLGELQHRAKNSFGMIHSMIGLASRAASSKEAKAALSELETRVRSVSELYSLLYSEGTVASLRLDEYCKRVAAPLVGLAGDIVLETETESMLISAKMAAPIGLIVTELVTNAIKYAFPGGRKGVIALALAKSERGGRLEISDDGVGLPAGFDAATDSGMGLNLVRALTSQIDGDFSVEKSAPGTRCVVEFALS